jgi:hypothetical protein
MKLIRGKFTGRSLIENQMENKEQQPENKAGEMHKRTEPMADGRRYIIYYTFGDEEKIPQPTEVRENV